ncbi:MAG: hypothetical protein GX591_18840 [Planctomycetes bacterium]|nr:hypothetical protein [Planctomycetota bacterium]
MTEVLNYSAPRLSAPLLRQSARPYVRTLSRGALAILISVFLEIGAFFMHLLAARVEAPAIITAGFASLPVLTALAGTWMLTVADRSLPGDLRRGRLRWFLRASAMGVVALTMAPIFVDHGGVAFKGRQVLAALALGAAAVQVAAAFALFAYFVHLARRIPDLVLADRTRQLLWLLVGVRALGLFGILLAVALAVLGTVTGRIAAAETNVLYATVLIPVWLVLRVAVNLWWMVLLREYYVHFTRQIAFARRRPTVQAYLPESR